MRKIWMGMGVLGGLWLGACVLTPIAGAHQSVQDAQELQPGVPVAWQSSAEPGCVELALEEHGNGVFQHTRQGIQELRRSRPVHYAVIGGKG